MRSGYGQTIFGASGGIAERDRQPVQAGGLNQKSLAFWQLLFNYLRETRQN
jgi:hypothetical protein